MADSAETEAQTAPAEPQARHIVYCGVCTLPPEYCEFGGTAKKCEEWIQTTHPDLHQKLYSEEAIAANLSALSLEARQRAAKDAAKKEAKAALVETRNQERKAAAMIQIKRVERNKRKFVTVVAGVEAHCGLDLKKLAKELGKKFATGSSVTKNPAGAEEITVQGDVSDDVLEWLVETKGVPEDNVELVEDKKKKKAAE
ncbi:Translation machinery-associated protein 22 [Ophidiomyces ophidiicola]|nr:Translation machinery-associated protein 22 [Ophidiomyces ophidiicola]KAI1941848.1 Translation machinery-associated protein 22 [Ophidiomyces ophidiicola]KAI1962926.1 Translation machinery-associated protein 22 [Ophidiomyces ophidiicola]